VKEKIIRNIMTSSTKKKGKGIIEKRTLQKEERIVRQEKV
jgi:hypothetical protein